MYHFLKQLIMPLTFLMVYQMMVTLNIKSLLKNQTINYVIKKFKVYIVIIKI